MNKKQKLVLSFVLAIFGILVFYYGYSVGCPASAPQSCSTASGSNLPTARAIQSSAYEDMGAAIAISPVIIWILYESESHGSKKE